MIPERFMFKAKTFDGKEIRGYLRKTGENQIEKPNGQYIRTEEYFQIQDDRYQSQFVDPATIERIAAKVFDDRHAHDICCPSCNYCFALEIAIEADRHFGAVMGYRVPQHCPDCGMRLDWE